MAKKLLKPKRGKVENLSKLAVEDGALVFAYDTKATTSTVLVDIGDTRYDLAAGAAKKADNADALGGSSLQNIVDKINNSTGNGTAFTGLDTTTNNKVKLTRANGGTVEKIINNVSNASTADYAKSASNASTAIYLGRNPIARPTNLNIGITGAGGIRTFIANGNITNKAPFDAHIIHLDWDNTGGWDAQIAVEAAKDGHMAVRGMGGSVWGSWNTVLDSANYTSYAAKKNAYNSASVSNATITLGRSDGSTSTTLTVNNVAHATSADLAKNSNALGGSSLSQILTTAGGGNAFTAIDTATNNVIKLTRANGGTVQKTVNNVSNATSASVAKLISPFENATANVSRNVWFSDSVVRNKACYNDNFKYNPVSQELTAIATTSKYATGGESESNYQLNSTNLHATIDLTSSTYNQNTWYPVVGSGLPYRGYSRIICYVQLNSGTKPTWSTHGSGFTCNLDVLVKAGGWGTTNAGTIVLDYSWSFTQSNVSPISYQQLNNSSRPVIWMRGGGKYFIRSSEKFTWEVKTSPYTISSQTIAPQTSCPGLSLTRSTIYANINGSVASAGSATNASTAEYAKNAGKLGGVEASKYAKKEDIPVIPSNLDVANRLQSYATGGNIPNSLFYRYGVLGSSWSNFPVSSLPSTGIGTNFQGKNTGVLHIAAGSSYHDLAFTAGAKDNQGILYAGTGRNPAYILDTENYKTKGNVFNSLTANTSFTAKVNVTIDGGSY